MASYAELACGMDPAFVAVLSEHLGWATEHPECFPHSENVSQSEAAWSMARSGFSELEQSFAERLEEWRLKWQIRFETEGTDKIVAKESEDIKKVKNVKEREKLSKDLYLKTVHLMIGDAQKHIVTLNGRADFLQENIRKTWHKHCANDSYSKILPSIEVSLQQYEENYFSDIRKVFFEGQKNSVACIARQEFLETITATDNCNLILSSYFLKIYRYVSKTSSELCRFYSKKWALYARGFRSRQNLLPLG